MELKRGKSVFVCVSSLKIDASGAYILTLDRPENVTQSLQTRKDLTGFLGYNVG